MYIVLDYAFLKGIAYHVCLNSSTAKWVGKGCTIRQALTEQLKDENQMEWVRQMNACKAQAEEVVKAELIYN